MTFAVVRATRHARSAARSLVGDTSSILLIAQLVTAASAFVANILSARALAPAGRGELALLLQLAYFGSIGVLLGTDRSLITVYTGAPIRAVTRAANRLLVRPSAWGLAGAAAFLFLPVPGLGSWRVRGLLAALFMVVTAYSRLIRSIAIVNDRRRELVVYSVLREALLMATLVTLAVTGSSDPAVWLGAYLVVGLVPTVIWFLRWAADPTPGDTPAPERAPARRSARREGLQLVFATIAQNGTLRIDRILLVWLASEAELGIYAAVATMTELVAWPLVAFADSRLGRWRRAHEQGELHAGRLVARCATVAAGSGVAVGLVLWLLLVPVLGPDYAGARVLVVPLVIASAVYATAQLLIALLTAVARNTWASAVEVVGLVVSIVAYVLLIGRYGALGAAWGSLVGYAAVLITGTVLLHRALSTDRSGTPGGSA